jgi:hypothetical protein
MFFFEAVRLWMCTKRDTARATSQPLPVIGAAAAAGGGGGRQREDSVFVLNFTVYGCAAAGVPSVAHHSSLQLGENLLEHNSIPVMQLLGAQSGRNAEGLLRTFTTDEACS